MKILITGATGFVGSHLCEELTRQGHKVFALARNKKKFQKFQIPGHLIQAPLKAGLENKWIESLPDDLDAVIHTAGIVHSFNKDDFFQVNAEVTKGLVTDLAKKYDQLTFIHISSMAAAGPSQDNRVRKETDKADPVSDYGRSKLASEELVNSAPQGWDIKILRPPMVIGPRDPAVLDIFKMVKSKNILVTGTKGLYKKYSFICVYDLVNLIIKSLHAPVTRNSNIYFTAFEQSITMQELFSEIQEQLDVEKVRYIKVPESVIKVLSIGLYYINKIISHDIRLTPDKYHELASPNWECSGAKAAVEFDFEYSWNLKKTVEATLKDYQERNWL